MLVKRRFTWTRKIVKKYFPFVPAEVAEKWERRFAFAYFFVGWNALALVGYLWYRRTEQKYATGDERADRINRVKRLMSASQSENIRMIEYHGFKKVSDENISGAFEPGRPFPIPERGHVDHESSSTSESR